MVRNNSKHTGIAQAHTIQARRVAAGKRGYAKAVRRFFMRAHPARTGDYHAKLRSLPAIWPVTSLYE